MSIKSEFPPAKVVAVLMKSNGSMELQYFFLLLLELQERYSAAVNSYRMIQYDINVGAQYSIELGIFDLVR